MKLIDEVTIEVRSGKGGNGCVSFRREKYVPFGGPNGGNGGRGGSVVMEATRDKTSLLDFKFQPNYEGKRGEHGMGSDCDGRSGEDLLLKVPMGTLIYDEHGTCIADLTHHGQRVVVAKGGKGGRGNKTFTTSTNRAPRIATPGRDGEEKTLKLELRLLADVGLLGLPNAGKSSFLRATTRAKPTVADYPFTTLNPHLGVVEQKDQTIIISDLPGLIEGAHEGAGLGIQFLRHVMRNRHLLHLVDLSAGVDEIVKNIEVIEKELESYDPKLMNIPRDLVFTKGDLFTPEDLETIKGELKARGIEGYFISSHSHLGVDELLNRLAALAPKWREMAQQQLDESPVEEEREIIHSNSSTISIGQLPDWAQGWDTPANP
jgi:GTP-binding protein